MLHSSQIMGRTTRQRDPQPPSVMGTKINIEDDSKNGNEPSEPQDVSIKLDTILTTLMKLDAKVDVVTSDLNLLRAEQRKVKDRMKEVESEMATLIPQTKDIKTEVLELHKRVGFLEFRAEDAEGRARRNNLRIVGLPEGEGRNDLVEYLESWIRDAVVPEGLSSHFALERAHRIPARPPRPGMPPRPVIARLLNYRDRDLILQSARKRESLEIENSRVMIFPDFTAAVQ